MRILLYAGCVTCLFFLGLPATTVAATIAPIEDHSKSYFGKHAGVASHGYTITVRGGDTVSELAARYGLRAKDIISMNNLEHPYQLYKGQKLTLAPHRYYTVQRGDTLSAIASRHGLKISALIKRNDLKRPYRLQAGQKLELPYEIQPASMNKKNTISYVAKKVALEEQAPVPRSAKPASRNLAAKPSKSSKGVITNSNKLVLYDKPNYRATRQVQVAQKKQMQRNILQASYGNRTPSATSMSRSALYDSKNKKVSNHGKSGRFIWPTEGTLVSAFGSKKGGLKNDGVNIVAREGSAIKAAADGTVVYAGNELKGYGNLIIIRHSHGWMSAYAHQKNFKVSKGQKVKKGQTIGYVGRTGNVDKPQLHFSLRNGRKAKNPERYLPS